MSMTLKLSLGLFAVLGGGLLFTFERPPVDVVQRGFRGVAMQENYDPRLISADAVLNKVPGSLPRTENGGPLASAVYKNVQVLGGLNVGNFTRLMASMTTWVAPTQGCAYCHVGANFAADTLYTKVVARRMIQMVQHINGDWKSHVAATGVTCYTCHRGNPVPVNLFYNDPGPPHAQGMVESDMGKNHPTAAIGQTSLPYDPFTPFLENAAPIRVQSTTALPTGDRESIKQTDWTYALMIHFSKSLGVNCTYCHNTRSFGDWEQSPPQRVTAWYGIRMVRDVNADYLNSLHDVFPAYRLGALGDVPKVDCATCHQGAFKPLYGAQMAKDYPELATLGAGLPK